MTSNLNIQAPDGFEISTDSINNYLSSLLLSPDNGSVASTKIYVRFKTGLIKYYSGSITHVSTNAEQKNIAVSGTGTEGPLPFFSIDPESWDYGEVQMGQTSDKTFIISNAGNAEMTGSVSLDGTNSDQFKIISGQGSYNIKAGGNKPIIVRFNPNTTHFKAGRINYYAQCSKCFKS